MTNDVIKYGNPLFTIMDPLPLLGADAPLVSIGFIAQLTAAKVDFYKGNTITLPAELARRSRSSGSPYNSAAAPRSAVRRRDWSIASLSDKPAQRREERGQPQKGPPIFLPGQTNCVCLDVFIVGHVERQFIAGREAILAKVDEMDIVDIKPDALEDNIICYLKTSVNVVLREKLSDRASDIDAEFSVVRARDRDTLADPRPAGSSQPGDRGRPA